MEIHPVTRPGPAFQSPHAGEESLEAMEEAAVGCRRCDLYRDATRLVFGEGPSRARLFLLGEQPGDREDIAGRPFVGPAGRVLDDCLDEAGIDRAECYLTNAVKHFKFRERGKRRLHARPNAGEVRRCAWWLHGELALVRPRLVVAMGATAVAALLGTSAKVLRDRGEVFRPAAGPPVLVTIHPSLLLRRRTSDDYEENRRAFVDNLRQAGALAGVLPD